MAERLARAGAISLAGGGTGALCGLLLAVVVGRGLGAEGAGYFFQTVALFLILTNVFELGADTGLVRALSRQASLGRTADLGRTVRIAVLPVLAAGAVIGGLVYLGAGSLAAVISTPQAQETTQHLISITAPFVVAGSLLAVLLGGTRGLGSVVPFTAVLNIGLPVIRVIVVAAALALGYGVSGMTWAWVVPLAGAVCVVAVILRRQLATASARPAQLQPTSTSALAREFWSFSGPRGFAAAIEIGLAWAPVLLVAALAGPAQAGIFAVVARCVLAGLLVETAVRLAVSRHISAAMAVNDLADVRTLQLTATRAMILLSWPFYLTLAAFAPVVLSIFGPGFGGGATAMVVLCGAMLVLTGAGTVQTVLLMGGRSRWQLGNKIVALAVLLGASLVLIPAWGVAGAAVAGALTFTVDAVLATWQVHRLMDVRVAFRRLLLPAAVVVGTVGVPAVLVRAAVGPTLAGLAVHLVLAAALFGFACWRLRGAFGLTRQLLQPAGIRQADDQTTAASSR